MPASPPGPPWLLAFAMTASNLHGEDYGWFPALAVPANALWAVGSVVLAVTTVRARSLPRPLAVALPVIWLSSIMLSQLGGNLLAGALWAAVAWTAQPAWRAPAAEAPAAGGAPARSR
ncbi:hypothetical protein AB0K00_14155 [Dactylosporangium sp. NPDC049525]|uniref:hypothetical protein n=1 Tax=Dactylosporangium sp. NPDC049525 TaxID=3154730 RepID=UPI00342A11D4